MCKEFFLLIIFFFSQRNLKGRGEGGSAALKWTSSILLSLIKEKKGKILEASSPHVFLLVLEHVCKAVLGPTSLYISMDPGSPGLCRKATLGVLPPPSRLLCCGTASRLQAGGLGALGCPRQSCRNKGREFIWILLFFSRMLLPFSVWGFFVWFFKKSIGQLPFFHKTFVTVELL